MLALIAIACFVIFPLTLVGTIIGKNVNGAPNFPCRVNAVPRPIPEKRWFMEPWVISVLGGILPFGSIFIEMYFILTSFWAYKIYYVYGFILLGKSIGILPTKKILYFSSWYSGNSNDMCDNSMHLFLAKCWRLSLALDFLPVGCINFRLCLPLFYLLLLFQNKNVWSIPGKISF